MKNESECALVHSETGLRYLSKWNSLAIVRFSAVLNLSIKFGLLGFKSFACYWVELKFDLILVNLLTDVTSSDSFLFTSEVLLFV